MPTKRFETGMGEQPAKLMRESLVRQDRAALFFMLAYDNRLTSFENFDAELDEVLREWGTDAATLAAISAAERTQLLNLLRSRAQLPPTTFLDALDCNQRANACSAEVERFTELKLPAILLRDDVPFNVFTFRTGPAAIAGNIFDPQTRATVFDGIEEQVHANHKYTEHEPHCFADCQSSALESWIAGLPTTQPDSATRRCASVNRFLNQ